MEGHHVHSVVDIEITNSDWFQSCLHRCGSKPVYELETASCFVVNDVSKPGVRITWLALLKGVFQLKFNKFSKI